MTGIVNALYLVGAVIAVVGIAIYLKKHPGVVQAGEKEWQSIHSKLDALLGKADAIHAVALAPVTVALVPASPLPVQAPVVPPPVVNDSDPTAPGFVPPAAAPAPAEPPAAAEYAPDPHNLDFVRDAQMNVPVTDYAHLTVPDGWVGRLLIQTNVRPGTQPYSTTLNGAYRHAIDIPNNNNPYWLAYGVPAQPGDIPMTDHVVRLDVQQPTGSEVVFDFQPKAA